MKKLILMICVSLISTLAFSQEYNVDAGKTVVTWKGNKVNGSHEGNVKVKEGNLIVKGNDIVGGTIVMDMNSITCTDIEDKESNQKLVGHLKNADFFDVENFPEATLKIVESKKTDKDNVKIALVNLTIKGVDHDWEATYSYKTKGDLIYGMARFKFDRVKYQILYNSSLMEIAKDKMIDDMVDIEVKFYAAKKPQAGKKTMK